MILYIKFSSKKAFLQADGCSDCRNVTQKDNTAVIKHRLRRTVAVVLDFESVLMTEKQEGNYEEINKQTGKLCG